MKYLILLSLFSFQAFSQNGRPPIEELFKDVPLEQRQDKRIEFARRMFSANNDTGYPKDMTVILYSLNLRENPKHGPSYYYMTNKFLSYGQNGQFSFTPDSIEKAEKVLSIGLQNAPDFAPLHIVRAYVDIAMKKDKETIRQNALKVYDRISTIKEDILFSYAEVLSWVGEREKATNIYKLTESRAITPEEKRESAWRRAFGAQISGNHAECAEYYQKSRAIRKDYGEDVGLISCLNSLKRYDEALAISNEYKSNSNSGSEGVSAMDCHTGTSNSGKGFSLYEQGNYQAAEPYLQEAVKGCQFTGPYTTLAYNYIKLNNLEKAKETILEGNKHSPDKQKYLLSWHTYFKNNNNTDLKLFFYEEAVKLYTKPSEQVNAYLYQMFELKKANDPAFVDFSRRSINTAASIYESNRSDFETVKYFGMMNSIFGIKRDSLIYLAKAKDVLMQAKSMKSESDHNIEQNLTIIAEIESGIQSGKIQPSEP